MSLPEGYTRNTRSKAVIDAVWSVLKQSKTIINTFNERWRVLNIEKMDFPAFAKYQQSREWLSDIAISTLFIMFAAIPPEWDGNIQTLLHTGVVGKEEYIDCESLVNYFVQTGVLRDEKGNGLFDKNEFKSLYPDLKRILTANGTTLSDEFENWLFVTIAEHGEEIEIMRYIEVAIGLCHMSGLILHFDSSRKGQMNSDEFFRFIKESIGMTDDQTRDLLDLMVKAREGKQFEEIISYEEILKYCTCLDIYLKNNRL